MKVNSLAGKPAEPCMLIDIPKLITAYYSQTPDITIPEQKVIFGTSGHRGSSFDHTFNEWHIFAITQAICQYRSLQKIDGPLFLGIDTHALSAPAFASALEVFAANDIHVMISANSDFTPTPAISHAIINYNRQRKNGFADGVVITPSHNPPQDGGIKYNPPNGGASSSLVSNWIQNKANELLIHGVNEIKRLPFEKAVQSPFIH